MQTTKKEKKELKARKEQRERLRALAPQPGDGSEGLLWGVYKDYTPQRSTNTTQGVVVSRYPTDDSTVRLIT